MRHGLVSKWTNDFEELPRGKDFGNSACFRMRELKQVFEDYLDQEHVFDEATTPECIHAAGLCSVCGLDDGTPTAIDVAGALWYDYTNGVLYRDYGGGVGLQTVGGTAHGSLLNRDAVDAHTNYVLLAGDTGVSDLTTPALESLSTTGGDYTGDEIVSQGVHLTTPADHAASVIDVNLPVYWGRDKLAISDATVVGDSGGSLPIGRYTTVSLGRAAFTPIFDAVNTTNGMIVSMMPLADATPPDNYEAGFIAYNRVSGEFKLLGRNLT